MRKLLVLTLIIAAMTSFASAALTYDTTNLDGIAGAGQNTAMVVVDYDATTNFVFSYSWDDAASAWDALKAVDIATDLDTIATWDGRYTSHYVEEINFPGVDRYPYDEATYKGFAFYTSSDNENWNFSFSGPDNTTIADGDLVCWTWTSWDGPARAPGATIAVPEPMTVILLGAALPFMIRRKRK
ncbi:MAG: PEP-CTERM sorting domain-containing protein [Phycisphaerae bacterium]|nr:PEP-CTERM sorting domain-containing protein [Phycisphaerae bacterium]